MPGSIRKPALFVLLGILLPWAPATAQQQLPRIPDDLIQDDHVREEFGINALTTPSIRKLFAELDKLGKLPYEELKRDAPNAPPRDRTKLALGLGGLIADGFLVVQAEKLKDLENIGRAVLKYATVLGAGTRVTSHVKSVLEHGTVGEWDQLKDELAATQADVEAEMVQLRDVDAVHLISLGGWLRAFEIACLTSLRPFDIEKASTLRRVDIAEYFLAELGTLEPRIRELDHIQELSIGVAELRDLIAISTGDFTQEQVEAMHSTVARLVQLSEGRDVAKTAAVSATAPGS